MIKVKHLTKRFGALAAVRDLSFEIPAGQAVALWGPNGAGKTTVMHSLLGVFHFEGRIEVAGFNVTRNAKLARGYVGFVPQRLSFLPDWTARDTLDFFTRLRKVTDADIDRLLERAGLGEHLHARFNELSGGMKQRLALAVALISNPPILMLDEPTSNLDPGGRDDFISLLNDLKAKGKTILFSSHRYEEVESLADRILVLERGELIADCAPEAFRRHLRIQTHLRLYVGHDQVPEALALLRRQGLEAYPNGRGIQLELAPEEMVIPFRVLSDAGIRLLDFNLIQDWKEQHGKA